MEKNCGNDEYVVSNKRVVWNFSNSVLWALPENLNGRFIVLCTNCGPLALNKKYYFRFKGCHLIFYFLKIWFKVCVFLILSKKRVVFIKKNVGGKIVLEKIGVWTCS